MRTSALRLSVVYAAVFALALVVVVAAIYLVTANYLDDEVDAAIEQDLQTLLGAFNRGGARQLVREIDLRRGTFARTNGVYLLEDGDGTILAGTLQSWPVMEARGERWVQFDLEAREGRRFVNHPVRAVVETLPGDLRLVVGTDLGDRRALTASFAVAAAVAMVLVTLLALFVGYGQSRSILARVRAVNASCAEILGGNLARRLPVAGAGDEFDSLATRVNDLLDRLARTTEILRASLHSAAHDLRTPMHRMRLRMEETLASGDGAASGDTVEALLGDLDRMQRVLGALLQIAEAESGTLGAQTEDVAADVLVGELADLYAARAEELGVRLEARVVPGLQLRGHRQLLAQALANLIENALKFTPAGGHIEVALDRDGPRATLAVADSGPGIPAAERERAMAPFVRLGNGAGREGTGLGLSLAAAVARLHGGALRLQDNHPGLRALLDLPLRPPAGAPMSAATPAA
jgi:signal transduction histidine kinase